ncbi:MAG: ammonium transporter, Amt family [Thermodesulfobacteriota bacterium]|nr:ammonium transporter, Amt family [Thermodesulfobacteriota bacterium]
MDTGDTTFILICSALVMLMTIGLALFYAGMVRSKNALGTIMQSFIIIALISLEWILWGYSMAFGPDKWGIIGGLEWFGLRGVGMEPHTVYATTIPHQVFMIYQCMFAVITPALITGAFAERMRFGPFLLFSLLWATFVYNPLAHWIWGAGGWLGRMGALDFAGGVAVHVSSGVAALAAAILLGKREGYGSEELRPHNLPMTLLGAGLLWFGWFGFNAGSALTAGSLAGSAFVATHVAGTTGALSWIGMEWRITGKATTLGGASGAIAGLATVTPAAGFVGPISAAFIGVLAGVGCYLGIMAKNRFGYDDSLDVVGIHGVGGVIGLLVTGLLANAAINPAGADGLFFGNPGQLGIQCIAILVTVVYTFALSYLLLKLVDKIFGLRVDLRDERSGLDLTQHEETAYNI